MLSHPRREAPLKLPPARVTVPPSDIPGLLSDFEAILKSGRLTLGPFTEEFESAYADSIKVEYAVAVNSGTSALEILLRCLNVSGRKVIVPTNTFFATPAAALHAGGRVELVDVGEHMMVDPGQLERAIDPTTAAVVVVHVGGYVHPEIHQIRDICTDKHVPLLEDAAHAHGSRLGGDYAGGFGDAAAFSFYPTKLMTTAEGGMITTADPSIAARARVFRDQGKEGFGKNYHVELGYNWRMNEFSAAIGIHQLRHLKEFIHTRASAAKKYGAGLRSIPGLRPMSFPNGSVPNFYKYVAFLESGVSRNDLKTRLSAQHQVSLSGEVYEIPCHLQPVFKSESVELFGDLRTAERLCADHVCLPIYSDMTGAELEYVLAALRSVFT